MDILLANPRGFCAGVDRAIDIVERALELHGAPIYVRHEVVHNKYVVDELRNKGAMRCRMTTQSFSVPTVFRRQWKTKPPHAVYKCSMPPAHW